MSSIFGKKKTKGEKTVALVDIESGSVGAALVGLSKNEAPKLFAEKRISLPVRHARDSDTLFRAVTEATEEALHHTSNVSSRMRNHKALSGQGEIDRIAIFLSPPWASLHLTGGTAEYVEPMRRAINHMTQGVFGNIPTTFHPLGTAAAHGAAALFPFNTPSVLLNVGGEVSEILILTDSAILGHATIPLGRHTLLRTLMSHGGVSAAEAGSYMALNRREGHVLFEPMRVSEDHFASSVAEATRDLNHSQDLLSGIIVMAEEPLGEIVAKALSREESLSELFLEGGTVRSMRAPHVMPYIAAHAQKPDLCLLLEALFIDRKFALR